MVNFSLKGFIFLPILQLLTFVPLIVKTVVDNVKMTSFILRLFVITIRVGKTESILLISPIENFQFEAENCKNFLSTHKGIYNCLLYFSLHISHFI